MAIEFYIIPIIGASIAIFTITLSIFCIVRRMRNGAVWVQTSHRPGVVVLVPTATLADKIAIAQQQQAQMNAALYQAQQQQLLQQQQQAFYPAMQHHPNNGTNLNAAGSSSYYPAMNLAPLAVNVSDPKTPPAYVARPSGYALVDTQP